MRAFHLLRPRVKSKPCHVHGRGRPWPTAAARAPAAARQPAPAPPAEAAPPEEAQGAGGPLRASPFAWRLRSEGKESEEKEDSNEKEKSLKSERSEDSDAESEASEKDNKEGHALRAMAWCQEQDEALKAAQKSLAEAEVELKALERSTFRSIAQAAQRQAAAAETKFLSAQSEERA